MILLSLVAAWVAGILIASRFDVPLLATGLFTLSAALVLAFLAMGKRPLLTGLVLLALLAGIWRVGLGGEAPDSGLAEYHSGRPVLVEGTVVSDPEKAGTAARLRLRIDRLTRNDEWLAVSGDALVTLRATPGIAEIRDFPYFRYGDRLQLNGVLKAPPELEDFDYRAYLARQGIHSVMSFPAVALVEEGQGSRFYQWLYGVRRRMADSLGRVVPEPQASMGEALLLGLRGDLPQEQIASFRATGTSHILAISGLHVGILLGMTLAAGQALLGRRRHLYLIVPMLAIWLYALISGMSPSVIRAAIMGSVYLAALLVGRPRSVLPALSFAAAVMVAVDPDVLRSVSFQLSFAAVAGIAIMAEPLAIRFRALASLPTADGTAWSLWLVLLSSMAAVTVAAIVATLPLVAFYFHQVSLVGLPATLLVLPALPLVLMSQAAAGLVGLAHVGAAQSFGWLAWVSTSYVTGVVGLFARLPAASIHVGQVAPVLVWVYYAALALALWRTGLRRSLHWQSDPQLAGRSSGLRQRPVLPWLMFALTAAMAALVWIAASSLPDGRLHVVFLDVGQGDAVFITTPSGSQILADGGPEPMGAVRYLGERMPFNDHSIDLMALTHVHSDHVVGLLEVLRTYDIGLILERRIDYDSPEYQAWRRALDVQDATLVQARTGQVIAFDDGVVIEVLGPPDSLYRGTRSDANNNSVVLRLTYGDVSFLLTSDIQSEAEAALVDNDLPVRSQVLQVGHHGSRSSSSPVFLDRVDPIIAVISAGEDNRFGHPHPETLEELRRHVPDDLIFLTAEKGTIEFITDGRHLEVVTER